MDISLIIVNHRSEKYLAACISSVKNVLAGVFYEIIIVNNDPSPLKNDFSDSNIRVIQDDSTPSYGRANNLGAKHAKAPLLWFLNPDTRLVAADIEQLFALLENPAHGAVGMKLIDEKGAAQKWSAGFEITPLGIILTNLGLSRSKTIWNSERLLDVAWVSGCSFAMTKKLYQQLGGFDERFFMYFEDVDLGKKIRQAGKKVLFFPGIKVLHFGGKSFSRKLAQKEYYYASQRLYLEKHFGKFRATCIHLLRLLFSA